jgi:hypothetical protein
MIFENIFGEKFGEHFGAFSQTTASFSKKVDHNIDF